MVSMLRSTRNRAGGANSASRDPARSRRGRGVVTDCLGVGGASRRVRTRSADSRIGAGRSELHDASDAGAKRLHAKVGRRSGQCRPKISAAESRWRSRAMTSATALFIIPPCNPLSHLESRDGQAQRASCHRSVSAGDRGDQAVVATAGVGQATVGSLEAPHADAALGQAGLTLLTELGPGDAGEPGLGDGHRLVDGADIFRVAVAARRGTGKEVALGVSRRGDGRQTSRSRGLSPFRGALPRCPRQSRVHDADGHSLSFPSQPATEECRRDSRPTRMPGREGAAMAAAASPAPSSAGDENHDLIGAMRAGSATRRPLAMITRPQPGDTPHDVARRTARRIAGWVPNTLASSAICVSSTGRLASPSPPHSNRWRREALAPCFLTVSTGMRGVRSSPRRIRRAGFAAHPAGVASVA